MGNSLMGDVDDLIESEMRRLGMSGAVHKRAINGSGLLSDDPTGETPGALLTRSLAELDPDIVVLSYCGNHPEPGSPLANGYVRGSDAWHRDWNAELTRMVKEVQAFGASVYVVQAPPIPLQDWRDRVSFDSAVIATLLGAPIVNWWKALQAKDCRVWVSDGHGGLREIEMCFAFHLWYPEDEQIRQVRQDDACHLTPWGAARAARWTVATIRPEWN